MASKSTNSTIFTVAVVAIGAFVAYKYFGGKKQATQAQVGVGGVASEDGEGDYYAPYDDTQQGALGGLLGGLLNLLGLGGGGKSGGGSSGGFGSGQGGSSSLGKGTSGLSADDDNPFAGPYGVASFLSDTNALNDQDGGVNTFYDSPGDYPGSGVFQLPYQDQNEQLMNFENPISGGAGVSDSEQFVAATDEAPVDGGGWQGSAGDDWD